MISRFAGSTPPTAPGAPALLPIAPKDLHEGQVVGGRYEVRERLGAGGMGTVYRARDRALSEDVALKVLRADLAADARAFERFVREVKLARKITHPNVCRLFDLGEADGLAFLTMELLSGETLRKRIARGKDTPYERLQLFEQVARGLGAVHAHGFLHRDLKPENVLFRHDGTAVVSDFGLAIAPDETGASILGAGTPFYMSPEQLRGKPLDTRSDVFALGLVGCEVMTGKRPFGEGPQALVTSAILRDPPNVGSIHGFPPEHADMLSGLLVRALAKDPADRWPSADEMADVLTELRALVWDASGPIEGGRPPASVRAPFRPAPSVSVRAHDPAATIPAARVGQPAATSQPEAEKTEPPRGASLTGMGAKQSVTSTVMLDAGRSGSVSETPVPGPVDRPVSWRRTALVGALLSLFIFGIGLGFSSLFSPASPSASSGSSSAPISGVSVLVEPFVNRTGDAALDALAGAATEAAKSALRTVELVQVTETPGASWTLHATLTRHGTRVRASAQLVRQGDIAEPSFEVEANEGEGQALLDAVRERTKSEARLLANGERRRLQIMACAVSTHGSMSSYFELVGPAARSSHIEAGLPLLDAALASDRRCVIALLERARLLGLRASERRDLADVDEAEKMLAEALEIAPDNRESLGYRCQLSVFRLSFSDVQVPSAIAGAEQVCLEALRANPKSAKVRVVLARLYDRKCDDERAMKTLDEALSLDRAVAGDALTHLTDLALQNGRLYVAERASLELVALQEEEERLGAAALGRRAGYDPVDHAYFTRAAVLLRFGRDTEAASALRAELSKVGPGSSDTLTEMASLRGLRRMAAKAGKPFRSEDEARLKSLESELLAVVKRDPSAAAGVAGALLWMDTDAAIGWLERAGAPDSCSAAFHRALVYGAGGRRDKARAMLTACTQPSTTEQRCLDWVKKRAGL